MAPAVPASAIPMLDQKVDGFLAALSTTATKSPEYEAKAAEMRTMGDDDIRRAAESSNRLLRARSRRSKRAACPRAARSARRCWSCGGPSRTSTRARRPGGQEGPRDDPVRRQDHRLLPQVPVGAEPPQRHPPALRNGQDELQRDNVALNLEKQQLWDSMGRLNQYVYIAERSTPRSPPRSPPSTRATPIAPRRSQDVLFYVRQKHQDLLTQLAVSIQNYLAIDIVIKNNIELIKGVDRATTTTIRAAHGRHRRPGPRQPAARPRPDHRAQHDDLRLIERTSEMLKDNSVRIQEQAASATIGLPQLQRGVPEHLRDHGRHRHLQGPGPRQHGGDHRHPRDRGGQVAQLSRPRAAPGPADRPGSLNIGPGNQL
jgi:hypothetical protein